LTAGFGTAVLLEISISSSPLFAELTLRLCNQILALITP
jgi:hypothetical protein